jgi:bifunctional DNA-binding transcriptional regulator/antitoxin component of YhaV-PrlF toxin-antitoxin module
VTIPKWLRDCLRIRAGSTVEFEMIDDSVFMRRVPRRTRKPGRGKRT